MATKKEAILEALAAAVVDMDENAAVSAANEAISEGIDALEAVTAGLSAGMEKAGQLFDTEEYFVPELILCSDAMYAGLEVLKPHIKQSDAGVQLKVAIGVIRGDTHDIGKNLVKIMLETSGYDIVDLGRDVPPEEFVRRAIEEQVDVIAISTLMTTTMVGMEQVIRQLKQESVRDQFRVIIGGGPISKRYAEKIGADGYAVNAIEAVELVKKLVGSVAKQAVSV